MKKILYGVKKALFHKEKGIDGILVTIGLCIIAPVLCVVMKDSLAGFIETITGSMTQRAQEILTGSSQIIIRPFIF